MAEFPVPGVTVVETTSRERDQAGTPIPLAESSSHRGLAAGIGVVVGALLMVAVTAGVGWPGTRPAHRRPARALPPRAVGLPTGRVQALGLAGPLAVNGSGSLFVVDDAHHQVLVRLDDGRFRVVAGDGRVGFAGDGGPATAAALTDVSDITVGPTGDLYLADGGRVRRVDARGTIETVAGDGGPGSTVRGGTPAASASLGSVGSVAVSPTGALYLSTSSQILRIDTDGLLEPVTALARAQDTVYGGTASTPLGTFGQIAVDGHGDIYASSLDRGWSVYRITPDGTATFLGAARRSGGDTAVVQRGPGGAAYAGDGPYVVRAEGSSLVPAYRLSSVPGIPYSYFLDYFAFAPDGTIYADNLGESAFNRRQELVSVTHGHAVLLWSRRNR